MQYIKINKLLNFNNINLEPSRQVLFLCPRYGFKLSVWLDFAVKSQNSLVITTVKVKEELLWKLTKN